MFSRGHDSVERWNDRFNVGIVVEECTGRDFSMAIVDEALVLTNWLRLLGYPS